eukprot:3934084-Rhodomonas_salina.1
MVVLTVVGMAIRGTDLRSVGTSWRGVVLISVVVGLTSGMVVPGLATNTSLTAVCFNDSTLTDAGRCLCPYCWTEMRVSWYRFVCCSARM